MSLAGFQQTAFVSFNKFKCYQLQYNFQSLNFSIDCIKLFVVDEMKAVTKQNKFNVTTYYPEMDLLENSLKKSWKLRCIYTIYQLNSSFDAEM